MKLYLSSYEYNDFDTPRKVLSFYKSIVENRNVLIIEVDLPLIGQKYGLLDKDVSKFYLINRVNENAFDTFQKFPIDVHVLIPKSVNNLSPSTFSELQNIAWACLYDNIEDAKNHKPD